jgi:hypothetical protein
MKTHADNLKWLGKTAFILALVGALDGLVGVFVPRPRIWVAIIPVLFPLLTSFFVVLPIVRAEENKSA